MTGEGLFAALTDLLSRQNQLIIQLIQFGREELDALKNNDMERLVAITRLQEDAGQQLAALEADRVSVQQRLAGELNMDPGITLRQVLPYAGANKADLERISQELQENYARLQDLHEVNRLLIRQSLGYVNRLLKAMTGPEGLTYTSTGQVEGAKPALIDKMV